ISGIIISDPVSENQLSGILVLQSGQSGICLALDDPSDIMSYKVGDSVDIILNSCTLTKDENNLTIVGMDASRDITVEARAQEITPNKITLKELQKHFDKYSSTLVIIED